MLSASSFEPSLDLPAIRFIEELREIFTKWPKSTTSLEEYQSPKHQSIVQSFNELESIYKVTCELVLRAEAKRSPYQISWPTYSQAQELNYVIHQLQDEIENAEDEIDKQTKIYNHAKADIELTVRYLVYRDNACKKKLAESTARKTELLQKLHEFDIANGVFQNKWAVKKRPSASDEAAYSSLQQEYFDLRKKIKYLEDESATNHQEKIDSYNKELTDRKTQFENAVETQIRKIADLKRAAAEKENQLEDLHNELDATKIKISGALDKGVFFQCVKSMVHLNVLHIKQKEYAISLQGNPNQQREFAKVNQLDLSLAKLGEIAKQLYLDNAKHCTVQSILNRTPIFNVTPIQDQNLEAQIRYHETRANQNYVLPANSANLQLFAPPADNAASSSSSMVRPLNQRRM